MEIPTPRASRKRQFSDGHNILPGKQTLRHAELRPRLKYSCATSRRAVIVFKPETGYKKCGA